MGTKIKEIIIDSFRGYENKTYFDFTKNNLPVDLVVIHAPNGFGKTSFFEGVEWCLSGELSRFYNNINIQKSEDKDRGYTMKNKISNKKFGEVIITASDGKVNHRQTSKSKKTLKGFKDYGYSKIIKEEILSEKDFDITSHVLTQDGMDSFLRFTKSEDKFNALESFWKEGRNTSEKYRQLGSLYQKVQNKITSLDSKIITINNEIESVQITKEQVEDVNNKLLKINTKLEEDEKIKEQFSKDIKTAEIIIIDNSLKNIQINIKNKIQDIEKNKERMIRLKNNYKKYSEDKVKLNDIKKVIESDKVILEKFKQYELLQNDLKKLKKEIEDAIVIKEKINRIDYIYKSYEDISTKLNLLKQSTANVNIDKTKLIENRQQTNNKLYEISTSLETLVNKIIAIDKKEQNINVMLIKLQQIDQQIQNNEGMLKKENELYKEKSTDLENLLTIKTNIESDKLFANMFNNNEFKINEKYLNRYNEIKILYGTLIVQNNINEKYKDKKEKTLKLKDDITKLISIGKNLIKNNDTKVCPLCNHDYNTHDDLVKRITNSSEDILDIEIIQDELELGIEDYNKVNQEYKTKVNELTQQIDGDYAKIMSEYTNTNHYLSEQREIISNINNKSFLLKENFNHIVNDLDVVYSITIDVKSFKKIEEAYRNIIKDILLKEKNELTKEVSEKRIKEENLNKEKVTLNVQIINKEQILEKNLNIRNTLESEPLFIEYRILAQEFNLLSENQEEQIVKKLAENKDFLLLLNQDSLNINNKINLIYKDLNIVEYDNTTLILRNLENKAIEKTLSDFIEKIESEILFFKLPNVFLENDLSIIINSNQQEINKIKILNNEVEVLDNIIHNFITDIDIDKRKQEISELNTQLENENLLQKNIKIAKQKYKDFIFKTISECFNTKTINEIYNRIDPHPIHKEIKFEAELENGTKLRVKTSDSVDGRSDDPTLYNSSGQISVLSLSIFLAKALQTKDELDTIFMDDPIQYLDSINVLSFIDLLRTIITQEKRQIVISTHDKNFYQLLQKKLDSEYYNSKFIELESYGKIKVKV